MEGLKAAMKISQVDRSKYYRGLLVLVGRDRIVDARERKLMLQIGVILDFDKRFCENAMDELLRNVQILSSEPVVFAQTVVAECFLHDAIMLALVDRKIHPHESAWLRKVAHANGLPDEWVDDAIRRCSAQCGTELPSTLQIQKFL